MAKKTPEEVFTPTLHQVNPKMYVRRPDLESELTSALRGTSHIIIHGESGSGKSWLYKSVLERLGAFVVPVNMANASSFGSIRDELTNNIERLEAAKKTGYTENKQAGVNIQVASGAIGHTGEYAIGRKEPLEACFQHARSKAGKKLACLVFENLETIFGHEARMKELADIITLLDDERYAQYAVKLIIVGTPSDIKGYFSKVSNLPTVARRIYEIPEVSRFSIEQAEALIKTGFVQELSLTIPDEGLQKIISHICLATDQIPAFIHQYCLELAKIACANRGVLEEAMLSGADRRYVRGTLSAHYSVIEKMMNARETKIGRRNQCVFALGKLKKDEFKYSDIEDIIRKEFPESTKAKSLNVSGILGELANDEENPIIKRTPKGDTYAFKDPKYRMCIRVMLQKNQDGTIAKRDLGTI